MGERSEKGDAGKLGDIGASEITGRIRVIDNQDARVKREGGEVGEGEAVGGAASVGSVD